MRLEITDVETLLFSYAPKEAIRDAYFLIPRRNEVIIRVRTDEGIIGLGEAGQFHAISTTRAIVEEGLKPLIIGENPFNVEKIWNKMYRRSYLYGRKGALIIAMSGIETALWDIVGKAKGSSVYELMGGRCRDKLRAYASGGFYKPKEDLVKEMVGYVEKGFTAAKMKIGFDPKKDVEKVKAVREAIGDDIDLMVDANMGYTPRVAKKVAEELEGCDITWLEEPVPADDVDGLAEVKKYAKMHIAAGENEYTRFGFKDMIEKRAVDIVQPDVTRAGGILECRKIASIAEIASMLCAPTFSAIRLGSPRTSTSSPPYRTVICWSSIKQITP